MNIIIISLIPSYNRQGRDLYSYLRIRGFAPWLLQYDCKDDRGRCQLGVHYIKPKGIFSKFYVLRHVLCGFLKVLSCSGDVVVAINQVSLWVGVLCRVFLGCRVVYYSLEYSRPSRLMRLLMRYCVNAYIDVEENRMQRFMRECRATLPSYVINNMPMHEAGKASGGLLKSFLERTISFQSDRKVVIYAGSFQSYAQLPLIIAAVEDLSKQLVLVLMTYNLPDGLKEKLPGNVVVAPCVANGFYHWLSDADLALLPYEDGFDFNVLNCSPQKLFDCYACGVPYLASNRPLIRKTLAVYPSAGRLVDFSNKQMISSVLLESLNMKTDECTSHMKALFDQRFHYEAQADCWQSVLACT